MRCVVSMENTDKLTIRQAEVCKLLVDENNNINGVVTYSGAIYHCKCVVLATGTYLKARCIYGDTAMKQVQMDCSQRHI